jgi:nucleotide-binding universal stress UspA family protein
MQTGQLTRETTHQTDDNLLTRESYSINQVPWVSIIGDRAIECRETKRRFETPTMKWEDAMMRKIAIPLDGSPFAERVLAHIPRFGKPDDVELLLVRVIETTRYYSYIAPDAVHIFDLTQWRQEAENYLKRVAGELRELGYRLYTTVVDGDVATSICEVASAQDADLIAMTTHGRSGLQRWIMGSVADRIIRTTQKPVYLVRPGKEVLSGGAPQRILVPLDGSALAEAALAPALELTSNNDAELLLVQAVELPELWGEEFVSAETVAALPSLEEQETLARIYLEGIAASLRQDGRIVRIHVETGHPATVVASVAAAQTVDTIVMSTHGRSGLSRWVFGSVAEKVVRTVDCPVLLVRGGATPAQTAEAAAADMVPGD